MNIALPMHLERVFKRIYLVNCQHNSLNSCCKGFGSVNTSRDILYRNNYLLLPLAIVQILTYYGGMRRKVYFQLNDGIDTI